MCDYFDREPTADERAGLQWWNEVLSEDLRRYWCECAGSYIAADAWAHYKRARPEELPGLFARIA